jgi:hypothetical protein
MGAKDKRVDNYIASSADFARPILLHLRQLVHKACPEVSETMKWSFPHFDYRGIMCSMAAFNHHCAFGFWKARLMDEYDTLMSVNNKTAMGHFGQLKSLSDLPGDRQMILLIREAARLNGEGIKLQRRTTSTIKKNLVVPGDFKKALAKNRKAGKTFEGFNYSNKKEFVDWITEARTDATRTQRITTSIEWLAEGKIRNWKYANPKKTINQQLTTIRILRKNSSR